MKNKRYVIPFLVAAAMGTYSCTKKSVVPHVPVPSASEVIEEAHEVFPVPPTVILPPHVEYNAQPQAAPKAIRHPHAAVRHLPLPRPYVGLAPLETLPEPEEMTPTRLRCFFPLSLLPDCYVDVH